MAIRTVTCVVIECDDCGEAGDGGGFIPHWDSVTEACNTAEYELSTSGRIWCAACADVRHCWKCDVLHDDEVPLGEDDKRLCQKCREARDGE